MPALFESLRTLRDKPRAFHVVFVLALAWLPLLLYFFAHPIVATLCLLGLTAAFLIIHPLGRPLPPPPPDPAADAAQDEVIS